MLDITPCRVLVVLPITSFFSSAKGLEFLLLKGHNDSSEVTVGSVRSLYTVIGRSPSTSRVVDCHSVEELGFQLLDRRDGTLLQGGAV
jgi:hypothetical protein